MRITYCLIVIGLLAAPAARAETVVYVELTYPTPTTWQMWLTETTDWNGTTAFTPSGFGIAGFVVDVGNVIQAVRASPNPVNLLSLDDPPVTLGQVGFSVGLGMPPVDAAGLTQCFNAQNTMVADAICRGFGVTAGSYSVPDPATEQVSGPFAWAAPGAPGSANPGVLVFRGKRVSGATVTFGPDYCRQANVFMSDNPLNWDSTTVPVVGLNLQYHNTTAPVVRAGPAQVIPWGTTATLTGTVSDDGLPNPPALTTVRWWQGSGPGTVLFADPNAPSTTVTFSQPGTYLLNLEATDGELNSVDWVQIVVLGNQPPVVWARPDQILSTGMTLNLAASVSDDGMPNPPAVTTANWSMSSGPAPVVFSDASSAATSVRFTQFGTYVLRLTASDSELSAFQEATIQVHPDPPGDFSGDGHVTGVDFLIWQTHYPMLGGATKLMGDGNGDGRVTGMDFILWQIDYGCEHS